MYAKLNDFALTLKVGKADGQFLIQLKIQALSYRFMAVSQQDRFLRNFNAKLLQALKNYGID